MALFKKLNLLAFAMIAFVGFSQVEAGLDRCEVAGVYFRTDFADVNLSATDVFILSPNGTAQYYQGAFILANTDPINSFAFNQSSAGTWAFDPNDSHAIYVSTIGYSVPFINSETLNASRYASRLEFRDHTTKFAYMTDRQFIDFPATLLNAQGGASLFNPAAGITVIPNSHLTTARVFTKYPKATKLAIPDLARSP